MPDNPLPLDGLVGVGIDMREFVEELAQLLLDNEECPEDCECVANDSGHEVSTDDAFDDRAWAVQKARDLVARIRALGA